MRSLGKRVTFSCQFFFCFCGLTVNTNVSGPPRGEGVA